MKFLANVNPRLESKSYTEQKFTKLKKKKSLIGLTGKRILILPLVVHTQVCMQTYPYRL